MKITKSKLNRIIKEELQKVLDELTYQKMTEIQKTITTNTLETGKTIPMFIFVG